MNEHQPQLQDRTSQWGRFLHPDNPEGAVEEPLEPEVDVTSAARRASILVVDDLTDNLHVLTNILKERGYKVRPVPNGDLALLAAETDPPDLILLDIQMPAMNGYEVCERLKASERLQAIPIIFISALNDNLEKIKAFAAGGVDYITKPFQIEELHARVQTHLKLRRLQIELEDTNERLAKANTVLQDALAYAEWVVEERREIETRFTSLVKNIKDHAIFTMDVNGCITGCNVEGERILGYSEAELMGENFSIIFTPEDLRNGMAEQELRRARESGRAVDECWHVRKGGTRFWALGIVTPTQDAAGRHNGFSKILRDMTDQKQAEQALQQAHEEAEEQVREQGAELRTANEGLQQEIAKRRRAVIEKNLLAGHRDALLARLQLHIERMPLAYILFDSDFRVCDWNPAAERIFGYSKEQAVGLSPLDFVPASFHRQAEDALRRIRGGDMGVHSTNESLTKDGRKITCDWFNTPLFQTDGSFAGVISMAQDITDRKILEEQFRQAQKMEAFGQLAGGVAHDFNNLLTIILGYSEILLVTLSPNDRNRVSIQEIHKAGERAALLTRQLLAFSRKQVVQPQVLDLNGVVESTKNMLGRLIGDDITLATVLSPGLDRVKVDPGFVEQVIVNLVVNARDAMPEGGGITIETANVILDEGFGHGELVPGRYVLLAVTDTGCGMTEEVKRRIFEPFFTTKEVGKGTGLGLTTVFGNVKQSGGHVTVHSEVGHGATLKVYLPSFEGTIAAEEPEAIPDTMSVSTETILLVEDEMGVRKLSRHALEERGYTLLEAIDGMEALEICERHAGPIHLLVSDVVMPRMGGRQLAERATALRPEIRVLFVSGYTDDALVRNGVLESQVAFLQKPYSVDSLTRKIRAVLDAPA